MSSPTTINKTFTAPSPHDGNGLFAQCDLHPGDPILQILPLIAVPDDAHLSECCSWCMSWTGHKPQSRSQERIVELPDNEGTEDPPLEFEKNELKLSWCTGCRVVKYCSKQCQKADWPTHKFLCPLFAHLRPRILPASVRATITLLRIFPSLSPEAQSAVLRLRGHVEKFRAGDKWDMICLMAKGAYEYSGTILSEDFAREMYCRLLINCISHTTPDGEEIGLDFDPTASLMNHSCEPNAMMVFDGRGLGVFAVEEIKEGEEVTICYIDANDGYEKRQKDLRETYWFECDCKRCLREKAELGK
ncbi:hypothetical protein RUND412_008797 [Rhizina undulata]